jgi:hypothetical protein
LPLQKQIGGPQSKIKVNVFGLRDIVKIGALLQCGMSSEELGQHYGENESTICSSTELCILSIHGFSSMVVFLKPQTCRYQGPTIQQIPLKSSRSLGNILKTYIPISWKIWKKWINF